MHAILNQGDLPKPVRLIKSGVANHGRRELRDGWKMARCGSSQIVHLLSSTDKSLQPFGLSSLFLSKFTAFSYVMALAMTTGPVAMPLTGRTLRTTLPVTRVLLPQMRSQMFADQAETPATHCPSIWKMRSTDGLHTPAHVQGCERVSFR